MGPSGELFLFSTLDVSEPCVSWSARTPSVYLPPMTPRPEPPRSEMYSLREFGKMIADAGRFDAYAKAIAAAVGPGDTVAEIGCGPGGFWLLACRAGARRVCAIEADDSM